MRPKPWLSRMDAGSRDTSRLRRLRYTSQMFGDEIVNGLALEAKEQAFQPFVLFFKATGCCRHQTSPTWLSE